MNSDEHREFTKTFISQVKNFRPSGDDKTDDEISAMLVSGIRLVCEFFIDVKRIADAQRSKGQL